MINEKDSEEHPLPDDLRALDEELSSIRYEERPSFGPELQAELARAWTTGPPTAVAVRPYLAAAALAGLLLAGVAVPSARASLVRILRVFDDVEPVEAPIRAAEVAAVPAPVEEARDAAAFVMVSRAETPAEAVEPVETTATLQPPIPPRMLDRAGAEALLQEAYPRHLQEERVGGLVWLRVWVDVDGRPSLPNVWRGSGVQELDVAALDVAPLLRFEPAVQSGQAVATWIEFPVLFDPEEEGDLPVIEPLTLDPMRLPIVHPRDQWEFDEPLDLATLPDWSGEAPSVLTPVESALVDAIGDPIVRRSLGPIESILSGIVPNGRAPTEWRASATAVLEGAMERAQANPAPLLALGRIRLRQGLRTDARMLFERGLRIAIDADPAVPPSVVAELHYERGRLTREGWLASADVGRVQSSAFEGRACAQARSSGQGVSGYASVERLIAWNYLCPQESSRVFERGFEAKNDDMADLSLTMGSFRAALDLVPGHVGSNVGLLVQLAAAERWEELLAGARRFARHSQGHPHALVLAGLALQRLGRTGEAAPLFDEALERLPSAEAVEIRDLTYVMDASEIARYRRLWGAERRDWEASYWLTRDRTPGTAVNEREIEHMARTTYAMLRFGGVMSDPGEVWVRFGGPKDVHIVDDGAGQLTEFWDYGSGPDITFVRRVASQTMDLTPEGRAYVDDLGKIFPPQ
jgi:protein TonB